MRTGEDSDVDNLGELGPVDWLVVELPEGRFSGEIAPALAELVDRELVRVLDLVVVRKRPDATFDAFELSDLDDVETGGLRSYVEHMAMLLSADDVEAIADSLSPGSTAAVVVWENTWVARFDEAVRSCGGQFVACGHLPVQSITGAMGNFDRFDELGDVNADGDFP
jgi:hypothetical protein